MQLWSEYKQSLLYENLPAKWTVVWVGKQDGGRQANAIEIGEKLTVLSSYV